MVDDSPADKVSLWSPRVCLHAHTAILPNVPFPSHLASNAERMELQMLSAIFIFIFFLGVEERADCGSRVQLSSTHAPLICLRCHSSVHLWAVSVKPDSVVTSWWSVTSRSAWFVTAIDFQWSSIIRNIKYYPACAAKKENLEILSVGSTMPSLRSDRCHHARE
ncbi:hypothetical protein LZ32DRAFT_225688 [Colletotrichum eremochloae]|nr:hypothetical protein LZ32DRAFT_225688 [Colletotrichum eremochloae]